MPPPSPIDTTPIVLVTGPPASGKSFIAQVLADRLGVPLIAKDAIKETLYDELGTGDVAWSRKLGRATFALVYQALETQLRALCPVIVEGNFSADHARVEFARLGQRFRFRVLEIHCTAPLDVLLARYEARAESRHPGHADMERLDDIGAATAGAPGYAPLCISGGDLLVIDTTSFDDVDIETIAIAAEAHIGQIRP